MKLSAGLLVYRKRSDQTEVLLVHPGGPYWAKKDDGVWSAPKGEAHAGEEHLAAGIREFEEEVGVPAPTKTPIDLGEVKRKSGKIISLWAVEGDPDLTEFKSNTTFINWPPMSGQQLEIPEVDRAGWFDLAAAQQKLEHTQLPFLDRLAEALKIDLPKPAGHVSLFDL